MVWTRYYANSVSTFLCWNPTTTLTISFSLRYRETSSWNEYGHGDRGVHVSESRRWVVHRRKFLLVVVRDRFQSLDGFRFWVVRACVLVLWPLKCFVIWIDWSYFWSSQIGISKNSDVCGDSKWKAISWFREFFGHLRKIYPRNCTLEITREISINKHRKREKIRTKIKKIKQNFLL